MTRQLQVMLYGATGHTGGFVLGELAARGHGVLAVGRASDRLQVLAARGTPTFSAELQDAKALTEAAAQCDLVINCAGPFLDTAAPVIEAALRARRPYIDVTAEQASALDTVERFHAPALAAGVAVVPAMAFFGGLGDLLASAVLGDWDGADQLDLAIALDSWRPTAGTLATGVRNTAPRLAVQDGRLTPIATPPQARTWRFPPPFHDQDVVELPFTEMVHLSRHLPVPAIRSWFMTAPLAQLRDPDTGGPQAIDALGRSSQTFLTHCEVRRGDQVRRGWVAGQDIYAITAPLAVSLAEAMVAGELSGVLAPSQATPARALLEGLGEARLKTVLDA